MPAKAGIQKYLKTLASRPTPSRGQALRGNDAKVRIKAFNFSFSLIITSYFLKSAVID